MSIIAEKKEELQDVETAKFITSMLRDISAMKMKSIRGNFKRNDEFFTRISELYGLVKFQQFKISNSKDAVKKKVGSSALFIAITSNKHFFGSLNTQVMDDFLKEIDKNKKGDYLVVGETGKQFLDGTKYEKECTYMSFENDDPTGKELQKFLNKIQSYGRILVFYPKFISVFKQGVSTMDISQAPDIKELEEDVESYIFEPELSDMTDFFEVQIRYLLFNRVILETELARTAARLMRMNEAENRAKELIEEKQVQLQKEISSLGNSRLLETFVGFKQWKK